MGRLLMIGIIIQARMGSSRLPGKILKKIGQKTLLEHIFYRLLFLRHNARIVLATSNLPQDDVVEEFCLSRGITCFRGSELNVLERYFFCARRFGFKHIVRLTADNPFIDVEELDRLIELHLNVESDYAHSFQALPIGVGSEIFTFQALEISHRFSDKPHHFEHVDEYILDNPSKFQIALLEVSQEKSRNDIRLTVDTEEDYRRACYIVENSKDEYITTQEAIELCMQFA